MVTLRRLGVYWTHKIVVRNLPLFDTREVDEKIRDRKEDEDHSCRAI